MATATDKKVEPKWGAWVWIKWKAGAPEDAWSEWKDLPEITQAWSTPGEWDCALWIDISDLNEVEKLVWKEIRTNKWVEKTDTHWSKKWW